MKKLILVLATMFLLIFSNSVFAYAASISDSEVKSNFSITGGLNLSKEINSTFDKVKTVTGKADEGSTVTITVYEKLLEKEEKLKEVDKYKIVVGASGYFTQNINLNVGENIVDIEVKDKNNKSSSVSTTITRKKSEIKNELEQAIILSRTRK